MDRLYDEVIEKIIDGVRKFIDGRMDLMELKKIQQEEEILYNYKKWSQQREFLKRSIFKIVKDLNNELEDLEEQIKKLKYINQSNEMSINLENLMAHSQLLGRNRMPPPGFENSNWYIASFPTFQMLDKLKEETEELDDVNSSFE